MLEIGCGTGRNLGAVRRRYPDARLFGIDISQAMLDTARAHSRGQDIAYAKADAGDFDPQQLFGVSRFDRIFISYALSMIPPWQAVLVQGGELHVVNFGQQERLPSPLRAILHKWLHVTPRAELREKLEDLTRAPRAPLFSSCPSKAAMPGSPP